LIIPDVDANIDSESDFEDDYIEESLKDLGQKA